MKNLTDIEKLEDIIKVGDCDNFNCYDCPLRLKEDIEAFEFFE